MKRAPAARVTVCLAAGIFVADRWGEYLPQIAAAMVLGTMLAFLSEVVRRRGLLGHVQSTAGLSRAWAAGALLFLCGACGYARVVHRDAHRWQAALGVQGATELTGRVVQVTRTRGYEHLTLDNPLLLPAGLRLSGKVMVYLERAATDAKPIPQGTRVSLIGQLQAPPLPRNPFDFDYGRYLYRRGIRAIVYPDRDSIFITSPPPAPARLMGGARKIVRQRIRRSIRDPTVESILMALLLGDRSEIDPELRDQFATSGLIHLLAVSGLHVLVVGFVFFNIAGPLLRRARLSWGGVEAVRIPATILLLLSYMLLTGKPASVVRAVIMASAFIIAPLLRRNTNSVNSLFAAAAVILTLAPGSLFEAGFQLSVSAVAAILFLNPLLARSRIAVFAADRIGPAPVNNLTVTASATAGVAPVLLSHFGNLSLAGLILNLPAIPLTAAAMISGVMSSMLGSSVFGGDIYARASEACLSLVIKLARTGTDYLGGFSMRGYPSVLILIALCAALLTLAAWHEPRRWILVAILTASLATNRLHHLADHVMARVNIIFYDVGQGDATLLTTASGRSMLVDAGDSRGHRSASDRWILPDLHRRNIQKIDLLVLTHAHSDHIGGVPDILRTVPVKRIVYNGSNFSSRTLSSIRTIADSLRTPLVRVQTGDSLFIDRSIAIYVLWPPADDAPFLSENDRSVVLRVETASGSILLTGDIERRAERDLTDVFGSMLAATVVKVPHHGSSTSSTPALTLNSRSSTPGGFAVISVAKRNSYGLPDPDVLQRWRRHGFTTIETSRAGAPWLVTDRRGLRPKRWRRNKP